MTGCSDDSNVVMGEGIIAALDDAARTALPYEEGGLLIGWRDGERVIVRKWLQIPTQNRRRNRFEIDAKKATKVLKRYLQETSDPLEGYVGAWHTHPALTPPSATDIATFRASAMATQAPLAFLVLATDGQRSIAHIAWSGRRDDQVIVQVQRPITIERTRDGQQK